MKLMIGRMMTSIAPWRRRPLRNWLLLIEAMFWLVLATLAIAILPFAWLGRLALLPVLKQTPSQQARQEKITQIRWSIIACARRVPWRALCFQRGLAAQLMLRRHGIPSVLHFGAKQDSRCGLSAHVWVCDRGTDVIGGDSSYRYAVLATFPSKHGAKNAKQGAD